MPLTLPYPHILTLPPIERNVLLICPGFFANHGSWRGISIGTLPETAKMKKGVTHVTFSGEDGGNERVDRRVVAEGYYGYD